MKVTSLSSYSIYTQNRLLPVSTQHFLAYGSELNPQILERESSRFITKKLAVLIFQILGFSKKKISLLGKLILNH
jgi:hypothetical protein